MFPPIPWPSVWYLLLLLLLYLQSLQFLRVCPQALLLYLFSLIFSVAGGVPAGPSATGLPNVGAGAPSAGVPSVPPPPNGLPGPLGIPAVSNIPTSGLPPVPAVPTPGSAQLPVTPNTGLPPVPAVSTIGLPTAPGVPPAGLPNTPVPTVPSLPVTSVVPSITTPAIGSLPTLTNSSLASTISSIVNDVTVPTGVPFSSGAIPPVEIPGDVPTVPIPSDVAKLASGSGLNKNVLDFILAAIVTMQNTVNLLQASLTRGGVIVPGVAGDAIGNGQDIIPILLGLVITLINKANLAALAVS